MYNRYIPQPDGSFQRSRMPDRRQNQPMTIPEPPSEYPAEPPPQQPCHRPHRNATRRKPPSCSQNRDDHSAASFLRSLLPKEFDTGDLMIVLLLLLMAGDCTEDKNTALLTLALYFLM